MKNTFKFYEIMEMIRYSSDATPSRKFEVYLRKEVTLSFISQEMEILEVGCGWGILSIYLALHGHKVTALDNSQLALKHTIEIAKRYRADVTVKLGDAQRLDLPSESFDLVIWEEMLEHLEEPLLALKEGWRVLRPKGKIILSVPNHDSLRAKILRLLGLEVDPLADHKHYFKQDSICKLVNEAGFRIISLTSDFIAIPKLPFNLFLNRRKTLAQRYPSLGHHLFVFGQKE